MKILREILLLLFILSMELNASHKYIDQIKVVDRCTYLTEVLSVDSLGIRGVLYEDFEAPKAIRACEKSIKIHPDDPHVKFLLARAYTKDRQYKKGFDLVKESCKEGDIGGCTLLGGYYRSGLYEKNYDSKKAYMLWLWTCAQGDPQGCRNLAIIIDQKGAYIPKDSKEGSSYLLEACIGGLYGNACTVYANHVYFKKIPYDKDLYEYTNYKACISGYDNACHELEKLLKKNKDPLAKEKNIYSAKASCNHNNAKACEELGSIYSRMEKNKVNNLMASTFYEEGCNNGAERFSCWYAGSYKIAQVEGVVQDIPLGIQYLEKSCYIGMNTFACYDLANFYLYTIEESYRNEKKATKPLERACKIGNVRSLYLGCDIGIEICCESLKKYEEKNEVQ